MAITKALGLGIGIIVLKLLVPEIFSHLEAVIISFLQGAQISATVASDLAASVGSAELIHEPFALPTVPEIRN